MPHYQTDYRLTIEPGQHQTLVRVIGPDQGRLFAATATHADPEAFGGPRPASVSWPSIGSVEPAAAKAVAEAIARAAELAS